MKPAASNDNLECVPSAHIIDFGPPENDSHMRLLASNILEGVYTTWDEKESKEEKSVTGPVAKQPKPVDVPEIKGPSEDDNEATKVERNKFRVALEILSDLGSASAILAAGTSTLALLT
jgi:hypothetical protein